MSMTTREALEILGLSAAASEAEIKQAYRDMAKVWHPDRFPNDLRLRAQAEEKLKQINEAYHILSGYRPPPLGKTQEGSHSGAQSPPRPEAEKNWSPPPPLKKAVAWVYGLQAFMIVPWFFGAIYRKEQSLWAWEEYSNASTRHGTADAIFSMYLYAIFYSAPFLGAFLTLRAIPKTRNLPGVIKAIVSTWATGTFLLLFSSFAEFVRNIPDPDTWNGWLFILWCGGTVLIISFLWSALRRGQQH